MMGPDTPLPLPPHWTSVDDYVESLLAFTTSSTLLQTLCGGVHVLDFYTRSPDLYSSILPQSWRDWFQDRDIMDILDLLMREDLAQFDLTGDSAPKAWRDGPLPPQDLLDYIDASPTPWHAVAETSRRLQAAGFRALDLSRLLGRHRGDLWRRGLVGLVIVIDALLEAFYALAEIAHDLRHAAAPEQDQHDHQHDQPVPD